MDDIAIVGMACIFPRAPNLKVYWENILSKVDAIGDPPGDWGGDFSFDPASSDSDKIYCKRGGYLGSLARFDPLAYGIMPKAVDGAEPEHFLALHVASEALKDAGFPDIPLNKERTEVILGRGTYVNRALMNLHQHGVVLHQTISILKELHPEYPDNFYESVKRKLKEKLPPFDAITAPGVVSSIMSGRIANRLDLKGANFTIDAACASSLLAVESGLQDLRSHKCDAVVAGGVHLSLNNLVLMVFSQLGALSRRSRIRPFDRDGDGILLGEGVGMAVLKRKEDAERDGNRIYALIRSVGTASDGRAKSVVAPRVEGEELAIRRAYETAGISPLTIQLIEAHGTATPLGDVTEIQSLGRVFGTNGGRSSRCALGSVKSMIGHLIPASGIASLIKVAMSLYHKTLPPTLHFENPIPGLEIEKTPFYLNTETRPWIHGSSDAPRRAGINAFGFGGINSHAILEEYAGDDRSRGDSCIATWETELCILSGDSRGDLVDQCQRIQALVATFPGLALKDLAYTVNSTIHGKKYRLAIVASSIEETDRKLAHAIKKLKDPACIRINDRNGIYFSLEPLAPKSKMAFVFPGEGSQYVNMLSDLCIHFPEVRYCFDMTDRGYLEEKKGHVLSDLLFPPPTGIDKDKRNGEPLWQMESGVQAVTTANRALFRLLGQLNVAPQAVVGHSSGEFGAMEAAGAIRLETDEDIARYVLAGIRSVQNVAIAAEKFPGSALIAVNVDDPSLVKRLIEESKGRLVVAMNNCPHQIIVCGSEPGAIRELENLQAAGISCTPLPFSRAYHTPAFDAACGPLKEFFSSLPIARPRIPMYSCATADLFPDEPEEIRRLAVAQWSLPVRFRDTIESMYEKGHRIFVEVGPRSNLTAFINDTLKGRPYLAVPVNVHHRSGLVQLQHCLGMLAAHGVDMDLDYLYARRAPESLDFERPAGGAGRGADKSSKLEMNLPMMCLGRNALMELKGDTNPVGSGCAVQPLKPVTGGHVAQVPGHMSSVIPIEGGNQEDPRKGGSGLDTGVPPPEAVSSRTRVMSSYFHTQRQFLESQERVLLSYVKNRKSKQSSVAVPGRQGEGVHHPDSIGIGGIFIKEGRMPFAGIIVSEVSGEEVLIRRELDLGEDLFLKHHVLGGKVSIFDEELIPLPVMPLTMSIEMLGEAAAQLNKGKLLVGMKNIRANRWVVIEGQKLGLELFATRMGENEVFVVMREVDPGGVRVSMPVVEATAIFSNDYPEPPEVGGFSLRSGKKSRFTPGNVYTTGMFNGPSFQGIASVERWGEDGSLAVLQALRSDNLFRSTSAPKFVTDPVILDAIGQQAAHWNAESSSKGFNFFPYQVKEFRMYGPTLSFPQKAESRLRITPLSDGRFVSDIDLIGPDGKMRMQVFGWEDKSFDLPEIFYGIRHGVPDDTIGTPWPDPVTALSRKHYCECRRIEGLSEDLLLAHGKIWLKVLARQILSRNELGVWRNLDYPDNRKVEWLLGKAAAKEAVRHIMRRLHRLDLPFADIEIGSDDNGAPIIGGMWSNTIGHVPSVSISHTRGMAVALAVDGKEISGVGVDVECVRSIADGFIDVAFGPDEQSLLRANTLRNDAEWVLRLWCAKEAVAKAAGVRLGGDPQNLVIREVHHNEGHVKIGFSDAITQAKPKLKGEIITAYTCRIGDIITGAAISTRS